MKLILESPQHHFCKGTLEYHIIKGRHGYQLKKVCPRCKEIKHGIWIVAMWIGFLVALTN